MYPPVYCEYCNKNTNGLVESNDATETIGDVTYHYTKETAHCRICHTERYDRTIHNRNLNRRVEAYLNQSRKSS